MLQAPEPARERCTNPAKAGYESGEQAAVSTPPIADIGLTPRKRKPAESVRAVGGPANKLRRLEVVREEPSPQAMQADATKATHQPSSMDAAPAMPYKHAACGAYVAATAPVQRAPPPSLLGPASKPLDITLQARRCSKHALHMAIAAAASGRLERQQLCVTGTIVMTTWQGAVPRLDSAVRIMYHQCAHH